MKIFIKHLFSAMLLIMTPVLAETPDPGSELLRVQQELSTSTAAQAELVRSMAVAIRAQEEISGKLVDMARISADQELVVAKTSARIEILSRDHAEAQLALAKKRDALSSLLAGLQRLEQNPPPALVVEPGDVLKALRGAMMFGAVIPDLRAQTDGLKAALADVSKVKTALAEEKARATAALAALQTTRSEMRLLLDQKKLLARNSAQDLAKERTKSAELTHKAKSLKDLVTALEKAQAEEAAKLAEEDKARIAAEAAAEEQRQATLARPKLQFSTAMGQLTFPVQGKTLRNFGDDTGLGAQLEGQLFETAQKAQVLSPVDGKIEFAGTFMSYDQLVIINPGEGYLVLLAGMAEISAAPGQSVRAGEPVGMMGERPAAMALVADLMNLQSPVLYVEFRKKNRSIDPAPWWVAGRKEAMR